MDVFDTIQTKTFVTFFYYMSKLNYQLLGEYFPLINVIFITLLLCSAAILFIISLEYRFHVRSRIDVKIAQDLVEAVLWSGECRAVAATS